MLNDKELEAIRQKMYAHEETPPSSAWGKIQQDIQYKPWWKRMPFWWTAVFVSGLLAVAMISDTISEEKGEQYLTQASSEKIWKQESQKKPAVQKERLKLPNVQSDSSKAQKQAIHPSESIKEAEKGFLAEEARIARDEKESLTEISTLVPEQKDMLIKWQEHENQVRPIAGQKPQMHAFFKAPKGSLMMLELLTNSKEGEEGMIDSSEKEFIGEELNNSIIPSREGKKGASYVGLHFTPQYTYRFIVPTADDEIYVINIQSGNHSALERRGYSVGLQYGKSITENILLETGISLLSLSQDLTYQYNSGEVDTLVYNLQEDGRVILQPTLTERERTLSSQYAYGSLQLGMQYFFWQNQQRRFNLYLGGGMNLLVKGKTKEYVDGALIRTTRFPSEDNPLEQSNYHLQIGAGYNRKFARRYELNVMPSLSYFLGSTYREREPLGIRSYTVGLKFQLRRYLNSSTL